MNEEEYDSDDGSSGSESEGDDEEPKLKYQRLGDSVKVILERDSATCMTVNEKFLTLGTQSGRVYMLDFNGNEIKNFPAHSSAVNEISIDETGEYLASCSSDGKVVINGLYAPETVEYNFRSPLLSVALDPQYARAKQKSFVCGGTAGTLIKSQKGFWRSSNTPIHSGEGPIFAISWRGTLIAWANEIGVKIFDVNTNQRITYIDRPKGSPRPELYRCHLCWEDEKTLLIGWADCLKIAVIKERSSYTADLPTRFVEIVGIFQTDFFICGIAPFGGYFVLLAYVEEEDENKNKVKQAPELRILTHKGEEISGEVLEIRGYLSLSATSYQLAHIPSESLFYIVSPKDIVVAKPRDLDDHITWLIDPSRARYKEALEAAEANESQLKKHKLIDIGEKYLLHLLDTKQPKEAAALCPKILKRDAALWEKWIAQFAKREQLDAIGTYIPVGNPVLQPLIYEMVLNHYLWHDHTMFLQLVTEWPHTLYNIHNIITAVLERVKHTSHGLLMDALATLYTYDKQFDKTLHIYLRLKRPNAFDLITKHNLFHAIQDKVLLLMECDQEKAIALFASNTDKIPIKQVVEQLNYHPRLQHAYLHALFVKNPHAGADYHLLSIKLYAEFNYRELMPFLVQTIYPLEKAYKIVEEKKLYPEMVYILGRMGNSKDALDLIIEKIGDVKMAIDFIQEQHDEEDLWENLIEHSMKNPKFVSGLLENIGASEYVKPLDLIQRIPNGMEIIGLRDRLVKIISDYNLQMALREGCNSILKADCVNLMARLDKNQRRGMQITAEMRCPLCNACIVVPSKLCEEVVAFFCSHVYHSRCLKMALHTIEQGGDVTQNPNEELKYDKLKSNQQELTDRISLKGQGLSCVICHQNKARQMRKQQQQQQRKGDEF